MSNQVLNKWNSWNVAGINMFSSAKAGLEVFFELRHGGRFLSEVRNHHLSRIRHYSIEQGYFDYDIQFEDTNLSVEVTADNETIIFTLTPKTYAFDFFLEAGVRGMFSRKCTTSKKDDVMFAVNDKRKKYACFFVEGDTSIEKNRVMLRPVKEVHLVLTAASNLNKFEDIANVKKFTNSIKNNYLKKAKANPSKYLAIASVNLTTVYIPEVDHIVTVSSREWCMGPIWGGYVFFGWDCFTSALMAALESKEIAYENVIAILEQQGPNGILPGGIGKNYTTYDRSLPPLESATTLRLYEKFKEKSFARKCYPYLKKSLEFYINYCDGNGDGMYEWCSLKFKMSAEQKKAKQMIDSLLPFGIGFADRQGAIYASGHDNSPVFDDAQFDPKSCTMKSADVGFNSLITYEAQCLSRMAGILGYKKDVEKYKAFANQLKKKIQKNLWDEKAGIFKSRKWNGEFIDTLAPMNFYPLFAGIATKPQAQRMVNEHLTNPKEFWGKYVIPTVARNHPSFKDQDYWRGRIWGPTNYLVFKGLQRYKFDKIAAQFAQKSHDLFMKEYRKDSHIHENYNAITGDGDDVNLKAGKIASDAYYPFGALLLLPKLEI